MGWLDHKEREVPQVLLEIGEQMVRLVGLDHQEMMVMMELLVILDLRDLPVHKEIEAQVVLWDL